MTTHSPTTLKLVSDLEIVMERVFDAPAKLVFEAHLDPQAIQRWWGPRGSITLVEKLEPKPGGVWRYIQRDAAGNEYAFNGVFKEIVPPEKLVYTFEFEGMPGHIITDTVRLEEQDGRTKLTATSVFASVEDRDGMLKSGMEAGAVESWDQLAEYLKGGSA